MALLSPPGILLCDVWLLLLERYGPIKQRLLAVGPSGWPEMCWLQEA